LIYRILGNANRYSRYAIIAASSTSAIGNYRLGRKTFIGWINLLVHDNHPYLRFYDSRLLPGVLLFMYVKGTLHFLPLLLGSQHARQLQGVSEGDQVMVVPYV
jgi:hypothetical protein